MLRLWPEIQPLLQTQNHQMNPLIGEYKNLLTAGRVVGPVTPEAYRANEVPRGDPTLIMGRSSLMEFARCPKRWKDGYVSEETKATEWGDLVDCLFLTPAQFKNRYAVQPATYMDDAMECPVCKSLTDSMSCKKCKTPRVPVRIEKEWNSNSDICFDWETKQSPKTIIKHKLFGPACDAVKVLESDMVIKNIRDTSQRQVMATASYQDEETGIVVPLGILIDLLPAVESPWGKSIIDFKTTETAQMRPWMKKTFTYNYDCQAALYLDVWNINTGEDRCDFRHIVQESYAPYQTQKRIMSAEFLEIGRNKYVSALKLYCQCLKKQGEIAEVMTELKELSQERNGHEIRVLEARLKNIGPAWPGYDADCWQIDGWQVVEPKESWMMQ